MSSRDTTSFEPALRAYLRRVARQARASARRLQRAADPEALHDFRVGVRRLRTWMAAFRAASGITRRTLRQWRRLARATNAVRDSEILLVWLKAQRCTCAPAHRAMLAALIRDRGRSDRRMTQDIIGQVQQRWLRRARQLAEITAVLADVTPAQWLRQVRRCARELQGALAAVHTYRDTQQIHRARICAKHVRYLLEPFRAHPGVAATIEVLTGLQDVFGKSNDLVVMGTMFSELHAGTSDAAVRLELNRQRRRARQQQRDGFREIQVRFLDGALTPMFADLNHRLRQWIEREAAD